MMNGQSRVKDMSKDKDLRNMHEGPANEMQLQIAES